MVETPPVRACYAHTIEGLVKHAIRGRLTPEVIAQLANMGLNLNGPLNPEYPLTLVIPCFQYIAQELYREETPEEAMRRLGQDLVRGYRETVVGRAALGFLRLLGVRHALDKAQSTFRTGNNYFETRLTLKRRGEAELWTNEQTELQPFVLGTLEQGLYVVGAKNGRASISVRLPHEATYDIRWDE
jgi:uncharacterized protein (TIGR02265 family)